MRTIFLDLDGVLCNFFASACRLFAEFPGEVMGKLQPGKAWNFFEHFAGNVTESDFYARIAAAGPDFWADMKAYPWAHQLYTHCAAIAPVYFVTACAADAGSPAGKFRWIQKFTGKAKEDRYFFTRHKELLARHDRLLIDDHEPNVEKFRAAGGQAIVFPQLWNSRHAEAGKDAAELVYREVEQWAAS